MKKLVIVVSLFMLSFSLTAQTTKSWVTVSADRMNVFYAGLSNPITVNAPIAPEELSIELKGGGSYTKTGPGTFNITIPETLIGKTVTVHVKTTRDERDITLGASEFRVKRVPNPVAIVSGMFTEGSVSKEELAEKPFIEVTMGQDFAYDLEWSVQSYQVIFFVDGKEEVPMTIQGGTFSEELKARINDATPRTIILFTGIRATSPAGTRQLHDIILRLN